MKALILSDGKPGHTNQARALCSIMGWESQESVVEYPFRLAKGGGYLLDWLKVYTAISFKLISVDSDAPLEFSEISSDTNVIITVGSASYYPAKVLAKKLDLPVVALMHPKGFRMNFDRILCPAYDNPPQKSNITPLPITLCNREAAYYQEMTADFGTKFTYSLPAVSVIIGGDNQYGHVSPEDIRKQLTRIFELTPNHQHWVTTSRRTSQPVEAVVESFGFDYKLIYSKQQYNPIPAFITLSEHLFVTSDSASMISECVSAGAAKVEVLKNSAKKKSKFDQFITDLEVAGCIHVFDGSLGQADTKISLEKKIKAALSGLEIKPQNKEAAQ